MALLRTEEREHDEAGGEQRETYCKTNRAQISIIKCAQALKHIQTLTHNQIQPLTHTRTHTQS